MFINFVLTGLLIACSCKKTAIKNDVQPQLIEPPESAVAKPDWFIKEGFEGYALWDRVSGTLTFNRSISFANGNTDVLRDKDKEGFYFDVANGIHKIVIANDVTVTGGFRVDFSKVRHDVIITGIATRENKAKIFGTSTIGWIKGPDKIQNTEDDIADNQKWKYGLVSVYGNGYKVVLKHLTFENSRAYNATSFSAPIEIDDCYFLDSRPSDGMNCDGVSAGSGSKITNSTFEVTDDAIKLYRDITVENVTIYQRRNGAPFQLGWGNESTNTANLKNILVVGIDSQNRYNQGVFSWVSGTANTTRNINIDGLKVVGLQNAERWGGNGWIDFPFFMVKSPNATIYLRAQNVDVKTKTYALPFAGNHQIDICDVSTSSNTYFCGFGGTVTGNK